MGRPSAAPHLSSGARVLLAVVLLVVFGLLAEGALSLLGGRSLVEVWRGPRSAREWMAPTERDRWLAAAQSPGPWHVHEDPLVGFCLKPNSEVDVFGIKVQSDALGMRARPAASESVGALGAPEATPPQEPLRIHVLGDSVAFGWGVEDDEALAHRLEVHLNAVRPAGSPPVVCQTVAIPGWNHRNAVHFLLDHWDALPADIVLYMPIDNDLANGYGVTEAGHRRENPDIATSEPFLRVSTDQRHYVVLDLIHRLQAQGGVETRSEDDLGPRVLEADLSEESTRRLDENAADIRLLADLLEQRGTHMMLLQYSELPYLWHLWSRLAADGGPSIPILNLLKPDPERRFTLPSNPHPNAKTLDVVAVWCAEALLLQGLVPGGADAIARLPAVPAEYTDARAQLLEPADWASRSALSRSKDRSQLLSRVDSETGEGLRQVYGGLQAGQLAARQVLALLACPGEGAELALELRSIQDRPDLLPLRLAVESDGQEVGSLLLEEGGPSEWVSALPAHGEDPCEHEIRLVAERDVVTRYMGRLRMGSYVLLSLELREAP